MLNLQAVNHFTATSICCGMSILYYARESALAYWDARAWEKPPWLTALLATCRWLAAG